jgi:Helix-turn-helix domain
MIQRCTNPAHPRYADWGGRGITIDPRWLNFDNFLADMGERPPGMTLERKDNNGPYTPWNCCWGTYHTQQVNSRNFKLTPDVVAEISLFRKAGLSMRAIGAEMGLDRKTVSRALSGKTRQRGKHQD